MADADWERVKSTVSVGSEVSGHVIACQPFGVFVDLGIGFLGLLEITEFADPGSRGDERFPAVGALINAWVLQHVDSNQQIRLTQSVLSEEQWEQVRGFLRDRKAPNSAEQ